MESKFGATKICYTSIRPLISDSLTKCPRSSTDRTDFLRRNEHFITLRQQLSQLYKLPFASSLPGKHRHPTSSGICPLLCSRVTQRVTQKPAHVLLAETRRAIVVTRGQQTMNAFLQRSGWLGRWHEAPYYYNMTYNLTSLFGARVLCNVQSQVTRRCGRAADNAD